MHFMYGRNRARYCLRKQASGAREVAACLRLRSPVS